MMLRRRWPRSVAESTAWAATALGHDVQAAAPAAPLRREQGLGSMLADGWMAALPSPLQALGMPFVLTAEAVRKLRDRGAPEQSTDPYARRGAVVLAMTDDEIIWLAAGRGADEIARIARSDARLLMRREPWGKDYQIQIQEKVWMMSRRFGAEFGRATGALDEQVRPA